MPATKKKRATTKPEADKPRFSLPYLTILLVLVVAGAMIYFLAFSDTLAVKYGAPAAQAIDSLTKKADFDIPAYPPIDPKLYDAKLDFLAHTPAPVVSTSTATSTVVKAKLWPVKGLPYPLPGAILPFKRIVAYYGNFYSKGMGVLGQYPEAEMFAKFQGAIAQWTAADPSTPVVPAIDYIAVTAQGSAGADGMYRLRMPDSQIDYALELAHKVNGIVILDIQVGLSNVQTEIPLLEKYLAMPEVHLALDPEFSMKDGVKPGKEIGTMNASDINFAANYLKKLVDDNHLPPKVLIIHRFTEDMLTGYRQIAPLPEVQIVVDMDGWGFGAKKINTYQQVVYPEPIQFTGFKLFYKNDLLPPSTSMLTPAQVLSLTPAPSFIQYQ